MAGCEQLANELQLLQNLFQHVHDPDAQAQIAEQIAEIQQQQQAQGCLTQKTPWAILLCKFKDDQSEPPVPGGFRTICERFFTIPGAGFNAVQFFSDMSHGYLDLSGSQVLGWFTLDVAVNEQKSQGDMMALAKQAAQDAGTPLDQFFGVVLIMNVATGAAQGGYNWPGIAPAPGVFADWRRIDGRNFDGSLEPRSIGGGNGTEVFGQEMGHGYGLGHSRLNGSDEDYQDPWDIMSTARAFSTLDPDYDARGPGLNAWNMRSRGWLNESRVWKAQEDVFDQVIELHPLHQRDLPGWLAAELPPNDGEGGHGRYLVEFRMKEGWDAGIPRSAVLVHQLLDPAPDNRGYPKRSYIMSGTKGNQDLAEGDVFAPRTGGGPRLEVQKIDVNAKVATVRLSYSPSETTELYRLYSPKTADFFYTISAAERDNAVAQYGFVSEGIACYVFSTQAIGTTPLYRLYNPKTGGHFYTASADERDNAVAQYGFVSEGIACYVFSIQATGTTPLYRLYNPKTGASLYTISAAERDNAVAQYGFVSEGIACYVFSG